MNDDGATIDRLAKLQLFKAWPLLWHADSGGRLFGREGVSETCLDGMCLTGVGPRDFRATGRVELHRLVHVSTIGQTAI